jgi:hypothetical protein
MGFFDVHQVARYFFAQNLCTLSTAICYRSVDYLRGVSVSIYIAFSE